MRTRFSLAPALAAALFAAGCSTLSDQAGNDRIATTRAAGGNAVRAVQSHYDVSVTPVADDLLETGSVQVQQNGNVAVSLQVEYSTCSYPVTYSVSFCPAGGGACTQLGSVPVMGGGAAEARLSLHDPGVHAGVFNFACDGTTKFSTGVYKPGRTDYGYDVGLEPVATVEGGIGAGFSAGTDPLRSGSITISFAVAPGTSDLHAQLRGAVADTSYAIWFCPAAATSLVACTTLGSLATGGHGEGAADIVLPPRSYVGTFLLTRQAGSAQLPEFITAFRINGNPH